MKSTLIKTALEYSKNNKNFKRILIACFAFVFIFGVGVLGLGIWATRAIYSTVSQQINKEQVQQVTRELSTLPDSLTKLTADQSFLATTQRCVQSALSALDPNKLLSTPIQEQWNNLKNNCLNPEAASPDPNKVEA